MIRTPLIDSAAPAGPVRCANQLCGVLLENKKSLWHRGYSYCSVKCKKIWPPTVSRLQKQYKAPIALIVEVSMSLFKSKKRVSEVLDLSTTTLDKLLKNIPLSKR